MKMVDDGVPKPADVDDDIWETLCAKRQSAKSKAKSEQMRAISKGRGSKEAQMRSIEKTMIGELVRPCLLHVETVVSLDVVVSTQTSVYTLSCLLWRYCECLRSL
jgi:hypothetical protein